MPFIILREDITKLKTDAVVNAANTDLLMGGGVCGSIFRASGAAQLQAACAKLAPIATGQAVITPGYQLPAKYIIHTAGPVYNKYYPEQSRQKLFSSYTQSLKLAEKNHCASIAFPLISSGIYGYPKKEALRTAVSAIRSFLEQNDMEVYLVVFDKEAFDISEKLLGSVKNYLDRTLEDESQLCRQPLLNVEELALKEIMTGAVDRAVKHSTAKLDQSIRNMDEPFNTTLLRLIDARGKTDTEVYKRANIDRKLFSKIRTGKGYLPGKRTVLALAVALELTLAETEDLLKRAGYALSHSQKFDVILEYFIINGIYDIFEINEVLFQYDQPLLGAG